MGDYACKTAPFPNVFLHGLIYGKSYWRNNPEGGITYVSEKERVDYDFGKPIPKDVKSRWEKMSKSKGNVIDPIEVIEQYGTDAVRMALCASATQAREIDLDRRRFEDYKNFANKVWNGARFVFLNLEGTNPLTVEQFNEGLNEAFLTLEDRWILSMLNKTVKEVNDKLTNYHFDQAAMQAYDFFWKEFCSYYVEIAKPVLFGKTGTTEEHKNKQKLLVIILCQAVRLLHPMAPFISEELFQRLKKRLTGIEKQPEQDLYTSDTIEALNSKACIVAPYPEVTYEKDLNPEIDDTFDLVGRVVYTIRNVRGEMKLPPGTPTDVHIIGEGDDLNFSTIEGNLQIIKALVNTNEIKMHTEEPKVGFASTGIIDSLKVMIPLPETLLQQERARLAKEENRLTYHLERVELQLANKDFVEKAPAALIEKQRDNLEQTQKELEEVRTKLSTLQES